MQSLGMVSLVVADYDEALAFYVGKLGFTLIEDSFVPEQNKRWVVIEPPGAVRRAPNYCWRAASNPEQVSRIGNQTGGRVFLFLYTDDFWRDFNAYKAKGIEFAREPSEAPYGTVAVFKDLYGTLWDLVQLRTLATSARSSLRSTSFSPDQVSSTAQTLMSTRPIGNATARMVSSVMSVGTFEVFFGHDTQMTASGPSTFSHATSFFASSAFEVVKKCTTSVVLVTRAWNSMPSGSGASSLR